MQTDELLTALLEGTLASTAAVVLVLALRRLLRRGFGAGAAYAAWALVPAGLLAVLLPASTTQAPPGIAAAALALPAEPFRVSAAALPAAWPDWLLAAWLVGMLAMLAVAWFRQQAFLRSLGRLRRYAPHCWLAESFAGLPALVGLWRPRIVLPVDFEQRFDARERALVLRHERMHLARGDAVANAIAVLLRCLFWFNPLLTPALRAFRHDQELACDASVLARRPAQRRVYGEAMFKAQLAAQPLPGACHWGYGHPLKERIAMLKAPMVSPRRQRAGLAAVAALALATGFAAWAAQPKRVAPVAVPDGHVHAQLQLKGAARPPAPPAAPLPLAPPTPPATAPGTSAMAAPPAPPAPPEAPEAPPAPPAAPAPLPPSHRMPPRYPALAVEQELSGRVRLLVDVGADGRPTAIRVESADPTGVFEEEAVRAVWQWRFEPAVEDGRAVPSKVRVPVDFRIDGPTPAPAPQA